MCLIWDLSGCPKLLKVFFNPLRHIFAYGMTWIHFHFMWVSKWTLHHLLIKLLPLHLFSSLPLSYIKCFYMSLFELPFLCYFFLLCANPIQFKSIVLFKVLITDNKSHPNLFISKSTRSFFPGLLHFHLHVRILSSPTHTHRFLLGF